MHVGNERRTPTATNGLWSTNQPRIPLWNSPFCALVLSYDVGNGTGHGDDSMQKHPNRANDALWWRLAENKLRRYELPCYLPCYLSRAVAVAVPPSILRSVRSVPSESPQT